MVVWVIVNTAIEEQATLTVEVVPTGAYFKSKVDQDQDMMLISTCVMDCPKPIVNHVFWIMDRERDTSNIAQG